MANGVLSVDEIRERLAKQKEEGLKAPVPPVPPKTKPKNTITTPSVLANSSDLRTFVRNTLAARDIDPIEELIDMYEDTDANGHYTMTPRDRKSLMLELLKYIAPQLKSMDINAQIRSDVTVNIVRFEDTDAISMAKKAIDV